MTHWSSFLAALGQVGNVTFWAVAFLLVIVLAAILGYGFTLFMEALFG